MSKKTKMQSKKNVARGQGSRRLNPLRMPTTASSVLRSSSKSRLRTIGQSVRSPRSARTTRTTRSPRSTRRRVQMNTPENQILEYTLDSTELEFKKKSPIKGIPTCRNPTEEEDFPCKMKRTIFKNKKDYDKFKKLKSQRNESTGYKSRTEHYDDIESVLMSEGYTLLRK
jgi:hypothetical protein